MTENESSLVTRRDFYSALTLVWTFIMLAFSMTVFRSTSPNRSMANVFYLAISLLMVVNCGAASWRGGASRKGLVMAMIVAAVALVVGAVAFFAR